MKKPKPIIAVTRQPNGEVAQDVEHSCGTCGYGTLPVPGDRTVESAHLRMARHVYAEHGRYLPPMKFCKGAKCKSLKSPSRVQVARPTVTRNT